MSSFISRRTANRRAEVTQQLIVFCIHQEWFALPIQAAQRVVPIGQLYGTSPTGGTSLMHYQDQEIVVLDVKQRLFKTLPLALPERSGQVLHPHLLIVQNSLGERLGIPLDNQPLLRKVPRAAFAPLSATYATEGNVRCVCALVALAPDQPPVFLLDLDQLLQPPGASELPSFAGTPKPASLPSPHPVHTHERTDSHSLPGDRASDPPPSRPLRYSLFSNPPESGDG